MQFQSCRCSRSQGHGHRYQIQGLFFIVGPVDGQVAHVDVGLLVLHDGNLGQVLQHLNLPVRVEQVISCLIVYFKIGNVHLQGYSLRAVTFTNLLLLAKYVAKHSITIQLSSSGAMLTCKWKPLLANRQEQVAEAHLS